MRSPNGQKHIQVSNKNMLGSMPVNILGFDFLRCLILAAHVEDNLSVKLLCSETQEPQFLPERDVPVLFGVSVSIAMFMSVTRGDLCVRDGSSDISEGFCVQSVIAHRAAVLAVVLGSQCQEAGVWRPDTVGCHPSQVTVVCYQLLIMTDSGFRAL